MSAEAYDELTSLLAQAEARFPRVEVNLGWLHWRREHSRWAFYVSYEKDKYALLRDAPIGVRAEAARRIPEMHAAALEAKTRRHQEVKLACGELKSFLARAGAEG